MTLKNRVMHSAFLGEQRCDERGDTGEPPAIERPNSSTRRRNTRGLLLRNGVWHIDKIVCGQRICESTRTGELVEAEALLAHRMTEMRKAHLYGEPREYTFRQAAAKFLAENQHKRSIERDVRSIKVLDPFIGSLPLRRVHQGTLEPYIRW